MKAIIQHNFTSGLGDFIADLSHYMTIFEEIKQKDYEIHLKISLNSNKYVKNPFFSFLFDEKTISFFDSIEENNEIISDFEYQGCRYFGSNHSPHSPGVHHFDIFFDVIPENFRFDVYDCQRIHLNNHIPKIIPGVSNEILNNVKCFWEKIPKNYSFLHIRTSDIIDQNNIRYDRIINNVERFIKETNINFHLGTNNEYIFKVLQKNPNIHVYNFKNYDMISNDMNAFFNGRINKNIESEILIERVKDIFTEMVSITNSKQIFYVYDISWISNFLFYPLGVKENKIPIISKNEWRE